LAQYSIIFLDPHVPGLCNYDCNRRSLIRNFIDTDEHARQIAVHVSGILEAMNRLYWSGKIRRRIDPQLSF
jgi:hypothetical protein